MGDSDGDESDEAESGAIAESNQQPPIAHTDPEAVESGEVSEAETMISESKATGPTDGDAAPENSKEGGPEENPSDDVQMVDADPDEAKEGELRAEDSDEDER